MVNVSATEGFGADAVGDVEAWVGGDDLAEVGIPVWVVDCKVVKIHDLELCVFGL